jgi:ATP-independent RNA helicase DbpA
VLVTNDVAARGLDAPHLDAVINVDITPAPEVHVHRIGRTGRASQKGLAPSLATMDDMGLVGNIEQMQGTRRSRPSATSGSSTLSAPH